MSGYGMHVDTVGGRRYWRKAGSLPGYPPGQQTERTMYVVRDADGRVRYLFSVNAVVEKQP